jgi:hypothetical protein
MNFVSATLTNTSRASLKGTKRCLPILKLNSRETLKITE